MINYFSIAGSREETLVSCVPLQTAVIFRGVVVVLMLEEATGLRNSQKRAYSDNI
jgi:hypothetical protein